MPDVMMALGGYRFAIGTAAYQSLRRATEYRWAQVNRIGRRPAMQYVGPGIESIDLDGVIYPHFRGGLKQVDAMRAEASDSRDKDALGRFKVPKSRSWHATTVGDLVAAIASEHGFEPAVRPCPPAPLAPAM